VHGSASFDAIFVRESFFIFLVVSPMLRTDGLVFYSSMVWVIITGRFLSDGSSFLVSHFGSEPV